MMLPFLVALGGIALFASLASSDGQPTDPWDKIQSKVGNHPSTPPAALTTDREIPLVHEWVLDWTEDGLEQGITSPNELTLHVLTNGFGQTKAGHPIRWPVKRDPYLVWFQNEVLRIVKEAQRHVSN